MSVNYYLCPAHDRENCFFVVAENELAENEEGLVIFPGHDRADIICGSGSVVGCPCLGGSRKFTRPELGEPLTSERAHALLNEINDFELGKKKRAKRRGVLCLVKSEREIPQDTS